MNRDQPMRAPREIDPRLLAGGDLPVEIERCSHSIIGCAIEVHRQLGPGLLESIYEDALVYELTEAGLRFERQVEVIIPYKGIALRGQRLDLVVERSVVVELKSITAIQDVHRAQLLSYLRAARLSLGLLLNFNVALLREGIDRIINERAARTCGPVSSSPTSSPSRPSRSTL